MKKIYDKLDTITEHFKNHGVKLGFLRDLSKTEIKTDIAVKENCLRILTIFLCLCAINCFAKLDGEYHILGRICFDLSASFIISGFIGMLPKKIGTIIYIFTIALIALYSFAQGMFYAMFKSFFKIKNALYLKDAMPYVSKALLNLNTPSVILFSAILGVIIFLVYLTGKYIKSNTKKRIKIGAVYIILGMILHSIADYTVLKSEIFNIFNKNEYICTGFIDTKSVMSILGSAEYLKKDIGMILKNKSNEKQTYEYLLAKPNHTSNEFTGLFKRKNLILIMMESTDDNFISQENAPNLYKMMTEGMNFTNFYVPMRQPAVTFTSEFTLNTGLLVDNFSNVPYDFESNSFRQSLPNLFKSCGYDAVSFHMNEAEFYNRGNMHPCFGYIDSIFFKEKFAGYYDNVLDYERDTMIVENEELYSMFAKRKEPFLNFYITYTPHMFYNKILQEYAPKQSTGYEDADSIISKIGCTDDMLGRLIQRLKADGLYDNTVIVCTADHYPYALSEETLNAFYTSEDENLRSNVPFFIYGGGVPQMQIDTLCSNIDVLPTLLNLFGIESPYKYVGNDIFAQDYKEAVYFYDGARLTKNGYTKELTGNDGITPFEVSEAVLQGDYYAEK